MMRSGFLLLISFAVLGCDARIERFERNQVYALSLARSRQVPTDVALADVTRVVDELFGSPDDPHWPADLIGEFEIQRLVSGDRLQRAAGAVSSARDGTHRGLYREHCVTCHGLAGSGTGPASLCQNPYPRDFRHGVFKWKSTERTAKPTRADLRSLLTRGVPSTAMPSFALLAPEDQEALIDYVIYLAVRGEVERQLLAVAIDELGYEETGPSDDLRLVPLTVEQLDRSEGGEVVVEITTDVVRQWLAAEDAVVAVPPEDASLSADQLRASIERGKDLFHGPIANCVGCHGPAGNGQALTLDYDDWTKEYSTRIGLTPTDREAMRPFRAAGAPRPRQSRPRNLQDGVFRGGDEPAMIYRYITQGIAGTPMPTVEVTEQPSGKGLTTDQVWDLVRYVRSLPTSSYDRRKVGNDDQ